MKKSFIFYIFLAGLLVILLVFPDQSIAAGREGLLLWFNIIIPTLFPFMILSYIILHSPIIELFNKLFTPILDRLLGMSGVASYALIMGSLSGYPMGAFIVANLLTSKKVSKGEGYFLLTICNNPSPMFVMGFVASSLLGMSNLGLPMLFTIYLGNIFTALIYKNIYKFKSTPKSLSTKNNYVRFSFSYFDDCITRTSEVLVKVGGYIILFSLPVAFLTSFNIHNVFYQFLVSTIDLSNGVNLLAGLNCSLPLKTSFLCALCAFGSLSVVGQTASVIKGSGLSIRRYLYSKFINAVITFTCSIILFNFVF